MQAGKTAVVLAAKARGGSSSRCACAVGSAVAVCRQCGRWCRQAAGTSRHVACVQAAQAWWYSAAGVRRKCKINVCVQVCGMRISSVQQVNINAGVVVTQDR